MSIGQVPNFETTPSGTVLSENEVPQPFKMSTIVGKFPHVQTYVCFHVVITWTMVI